MMRRILVMVGAALLCATSPARASDPVGVYALIDKVEIEPSEGQPEFVRLHGVFSIAQRKSGDAYSAPQRGFIYFSLPKDKQDQARKEWADLKKMAGTGEAVAFAGRYDVQKVKVRTDADTTKDAVPYSLGNGLSKLGKNDPQTKALAAVKPKS
jgi:hypothetical protein